MSANESSVVPMLSEDQIRKMHQILGELTTTEESLTQQAIQAYSGLTKLIAQINDGPDKEFLQKVRDRFEIIANGTTFWSDKTESSGTTQEILSAIVYWNDNIKKDDDPVSLRFLACMRITVDAHRLNSILTNQAHAETIARINEELKTEFNNQLSLAYVVSPPYQRVPRIIMMISGCVKTLGEPYNHKAKSLALKFQGIAARINTMTPESSIAAHPVQSNPDRLLDQFLTGFKSLFSSNPSLEISRPAAPIDVYSSVDFTSAFFESTNMTIDPSSLPPAFLSTPGDSTQEEFRDQSAELNALLLQYEHLEAELKGNPNTFVHSASSSSHHPVEPITTADVRAGIGALELVMSGGSNDSDNDGTPTGTPEITDSSPTSSTDHELFRHSDEGLIPARTFPRSYNVNINNYTDKLIKTQYNLHFFGGTTEAGGKKVPANVADMLTTARTKDTSLAKLQKIAAISVKARFNRGCTRDNDTQTLYENALGDLGVDSSITSERILGEIDAKWGYEVNKMPRTVARIYLLLNSITDGDTSHNNIAKVIRLAQEAAGSWKQYLPFYGRSEETQTFYETITSHLVFTAPSERNDDDDDVNDGAPMPR